jgi:hypothetical protein
MSDVPAAREIIEAVLPNVSPKVAKELQQALGMMTRRSPAKRKAPVRSAVVDAATARAIRQFVRAHPLMSVQEVAVRFHTNAGRVSEALHGDR